MYKLLKIEDHPPQDSIFALTNGSIASTILSFQLLAAFLSCHSYLSSVTAGSSWLPTNVDTYIVNLLNEFKGTPPCLWGV